MTIRIELCVVALALVLGVLSAACGPPCGDGTELRDGSCGVKAERCGTGAVLSDGVCVADSGRCPTGYVDVDGRCQTTEELCTVGTTFDVSAGECVLDGEVVCGTNTRLGPDGACVADACGPRTVPNQDGRCVIGPQVCGPGTQLDAQSGRCVQSSVVCDDPLVFDADTQTCRVGEDVCGPGARFDADVRMCLPDACMPGDVLTNGICTTPAEELAESPDFVSTEHDDPSTGGQANTIDVGSSPGDMRSFYGVIEPAVDRDSDGRPDQDVDAFAFTAQAGTWLEITVQALGIPSAAFVVRGPRGYERWSTVGSSLANARRVVTPFDGEYTIEVMPARWAVEALEPGRSYIDVGPFGDDGWDYVGSVRRRAAPTPRLASLGAGNAIDVVDSSASSTDAYIELDGYAHPYLSLDLPAATSADDLEIMVWAEGASQADIASTTGLGDIVVSAGGPIERVFVERRVARAGDQTAIDARLVGAYELGLISEGTSAVAGPVEVDAPVFALSAPAGGVVELAFDGGLERSFDLIRDGEVIIDGADVGSADFLTAFAGDSPESWYVTGESQRNSGWTVSANGPSVVDVGALAVGEAFVDETVPTCSGMIHYRVRPDAGSLLTTVSTEPTRWFDMTALTAGMERRRVIDSGTRAFSVQADGTDDWVISVDCDLNSPTSYRFSAELGAPRDTDLGLIDGASVTQHTEASTRAGETVPIRFTVPAQSVFGIAHDATGDERADIRLLDASGREIADETSARATSTPSNPDPALQHYAYTEQTFEVRLRADAPLAELTLLVDVSPMPSSTDSASIQPAEQLGVAGKQAWLVDMPSAGILRSDDIASENLGRIEVVNAASGEVALDVEHRGGDTLAVPLPAGPWLVLVSGSVLPQTDFTLFSTEATVMRDRLASPPDVFEPVQRTIPVTCPGTVDSLRVALQGPRTTDLPYVMLTSPEGTTVALHAGGDATAYPQDGGYVLPDLPAAGELDTFIGDAAGGDWLLTLYSATNERAVLDAVGLEVVCSP